MLLSFVFSVFMAQAEPIPASFTPSRNHLQEIESCVENVLQTQLVNNPFYLQAQVLVGETAGWFIPTAVENQWREALTAFELVAGQIFIETLSCVEKSYPKKDLATLMALKTPEEKRVALSSFYVFLAQVHSNGTQAGETALALAQSLAKNGRYSSVEDSALQPHLEDLAKTLRQLLLFTYLQRALAADPDYKAALLWMENQPSMASTVGF